MSETDLADEPSSHQRRRHRLLLPLLLCLALSTCWLGVRPGPATNVSNEDVSPIDLPRLPEDPYVGLCTEGCSFDPDQPPRRLDIPDRRCPKGACKVPIDLRMSTGEQWQIDGRLYTQRTTIERWTGPLVVVDYFSSGSAQRCAVDITPDTRWVDVQWDQEVTTVTTGPDGAASACDPLRNGTFGVGRILEKDAPWLDAQLQEAKAALTKTQFASDRDVSAWMHQQGVSASLARKTARSTAASGDAVLVDRLYIVDCEWGTWRDCRFSTKFTGPRQISGTVTFLGNSATNFCRMWNEGGELAAIKMERWVSTSPIEGPCPSSYPWSARVPKLRVDAPRTSNPRPPAHPDLPTNVAPDETWLLPEIPQPTANKAPTAWSDDIELLGQYFASTEPDPFLRVKAVHDWVALNIAYDVPAYRTGTFPPQDAQAVFEARMGVCAGYANLMVALGEAAGIEIAYIGGHAHALDGLEGHAWNAARIEGTWYLLDATWNAGSVKDDQFTSDYRTRYLFMPPALFATSHHPRDPKWLLGAEQTEDQFVDRPPFSGGFALLSPARDSFSTGRRATLTLAGPEAPKVTWRPASADTGGACTVSGRHTYDVVCELPATGVYVADVSHQDRLMGSVELRVDR